MNRVGLDGRDMRLPTRDTRKLFPTVLNDTQPAVPGASLAISTVTPDRDFLTSCHSRATR